MILGINPQPRHTEHRPDTEDWPLCPVAGCEFAVCLWAGCGKCAVHTKEEIGEDEMERLYRATRAADGSWNGEVGTRQREA